MGYRWRLKKSYSRDHLRVKIQIKGIFSLYIASGKRQKLSTRPYFKKKRNLANDDALIRIYFQRNALVCDGVYQTRVYNSSKLDC
jgi:hypothetical protein